MSIYMQSNNIKICVSKFITHLKSMESNLNLNKFFQLLSYGKDKNESIYCIYCM